MSYGHNKHSKALRKRKIARLNARILGLESAVAQLTGILRHLTQRNFLGRMKYALLRR
jgi:hypothetical protein